MAKYTEVEKRLSECIAWCRQCGDDLDPAHCLRSPDLMPWSSDGKKSYSRELWEGDGRQQNIVSRLCQKREVLLRANGSYPDPDKVNLMGGRLLVYYPYANVSDGASEEASNGYFDFDDAPPWDTWTWFDYDAAKLRGRNEVSYAFYLLCWVPEECIDLAEKGILANVTECIVFAENSGLAILPELHNLGLLG
jgi:hypothetical protein